MSTASAGAASNFTRLTFLNLCFPLWIYPAVIAVARSVRYSVRCNLCAPRCCIRRLSCEYSIHTFQDISQIYIRIRVSSLTFFLITSNASRHIDGKESFFRLYTGIISQDGGRRAFRSLIPADRYHNARNAGERAAAFG